jgi:iron complex transport system substrate-binding protein
MNSKIITYAAVIVAIIAVLSSTFIYTGMQNEINALQTSPTPNPTPTASPTAPPTPIVTNSPSPTPIVTANPSPTTTPAITNSPSPTPVITASPSPTAPPSATPVPTPTPTPQPPRPITIVDDEGYVTTLNTVPKRIVSLAPSNTQVLFAVGAGNKVVGVTSYDKYPYNFTAWAAAGNMTIIGGFSTPNKEVIASLNPDLIVATPIHSVFTSTMRSQGYKIIVLNPTSVVGVLKGISMVGTATGADENATALVNSINAQISAITAKIAAANVTKKPTVYYEVWAGTSFMTVGQPNWISDVIVKAGGVNIFATETQQWPSVSSETIVQKNPDVILIPSGMGSGVFNATIIKSRPGWNIITAVKTDRIVVMDGDLFQEAGPRIAEQITATAKAIYPDLFK